ncbi:YALIA101S03e13894g1_1 [Yarrowia lipolytica]|nr:Hypothetical protein YALI2_E00602g [Yarrowia lipolytica]SEI33252.1 YALIA101S03e13894g1_1 [Yarrowia lipolytica]
MKTESVWREKDYKHMFMRTAALMEKLADGTVAELQLSGKRNYDAIFQRQSVIFASQMFEVALRMVQERSHELFLQPKQDDPKNLYEVVGSAPNPTFFFERSPYLRWEGLHLEHRLDPSEQCKSETKKILGDKKDSSQDKEEEIEDLADNVRNLQGQMASLKKTLASKERETSIVKQQNQAHKILLAKQEVLLAAVSSKLGLDAASDILEKADRTSATRKVDTVPSHRAARQQRAKAAVAAREGTSSKQSTPDAELELKVTKQEPKLESKVVEVNKPEPKKTEVNNPEHEKSESKRTEASKRAEAQQEVNPSTAVIDQQKVSRNVSRSNPKTQHQAQTKAETFKKTPAAALKAATLKITQATPVKDATPAKTDPFTQSPSPAVKTPTSAPTDAGASAAAEGERVIAAATQALQDYRELWAKGAPCLTLPLDILEGAKNGDIRAIRELTAAVDELKARHEFGQEQKNISAKTSTLNEVLASRQAQNVPMTPSTKTVSASAKVTAKATPAKTTPSKPSAAPAAVPAAAPAPKRGFIMNYPGVPMPADMGSIASSLGHSALSSVSVTQPAGTAPTLAKSTAKYSMSHMSDFEMSLDSVSFANDRIPHKCVFVMGRFAKHLPVDVMVQEVYDRCGPTSKEFLLTCRADDDDWECVYDCLKGFVDRQTPIPFPAYVQDIS